MARREDVPVARLVIGKGAGQAVSIHGFTAAEISVPLVELTGDLEGLQHLTVGQAEQLAAGLMLAARVARGEVVPTPFDAFLGKRRA
jgi:hypothetical protein